MPHYEFEYVTEYESWCYADLHSMRRKYSTHRSKSQTDFDAQSDEDAVAKALRYCIMGTCAYGKLLPQLLNKNVAGKFVVVRRW